MVNRLLAQEVILLVGIARIIGNECVAEAFVHKVCQKGDLAARKRADIAQDAKERRISLSFEGKINLPWNQSFKVVVCENALFKKGRRLLEFLPRRNLRQGEREVQSLLLRLIAHHADLRITDENGHQ